MNIVRPYINGDLISIIENTKNRNAKLDHDKISMELADQYHKQRGINIVNRRTEIKSKYPQYSEIIDDIFNIKNDIFISQMKILQIQIDDYISTNKKKIKHETQVNIPYKTVFLGEFKKYLDVELVDKIGVYILPENIFPKYIIVKRDEETKKKYVDFYGEYYKNLVDLINNISEYTKYNDYNSLTQLKDVLESTYKMKANELALLKIDDNTNQGVKTKNNKRSLDKVEGEIDKFYDNEGVI